MSAELKALLEAQSDIHGRMSPSMDNLRKMGVTNITLGVIQARLTILDNPWGKIEAQHELIQAALKERYHESEYDKSDCGGVDLRDTAKLRCQSTPTG